MYVCVNGQSSGIYLVLCRVDIAYFKTIFLPLDMKLFPDLRLNSYMQSINKDDGENGCFIIPLHYVCDTPCYILSLKEQHRTKRGGIAAISGQEDQLFYILQLLTCRRNVASFPLLYCYFCVVRSDHVYSLVLPPVPFTT